MEDSQRAAELAGHAGMEVGLHLNLTQRFTGPVPSGVNSDHHDRIVKFLTSSRYAFLLYNPALTKQFRYDFEAQLEEFRRLYGREPSHIDGHHHQHLCTNILLGAVIPKGARVRRNFHFWPGEKSMPNRTYRRLVDLVLSRRYRLTDYFFALSQCIEGDRMRRVCTLAKSTTVEIMTHPAKAVEYNYLMSDAYVTETRHLEKATHEAG
jgi:predicted glycoside hydrolase/deacetylase ChbG (UPF0249 family)